MSPIHVDPDDPLRLEQRYEDWSRGNPYAALAREEAEAVVELFRPDEEMEEGPPGAV